METALAHAMKTIGTQGSGTRSLSAIREDLARAERRVRSGELRLKRQRSVLADLRRNGHDSIKAESTLVELLETQRLLYQVRDHFRAELVQALAARPSSTYLALPRKQHRSRAHITS